MTGQQIVGAPDGDKSYSVKRVPEDPSKDKVDIFQDHSPHPFKKWSGSMLSLFRELSFTAVAGVHTLEASQLVPVSSSAEKPGVFNFPRALGMASETH